MRFPHHLCRRVADAISLVALTLLLTAATGCKPSPPGASRAYPAAKTEKTPLRVLVVDDPPLGEAIARQWKSRTESEIDIRQATSADIAGAKRLPADVVVFPTPQLGVLAERDLIIPLPNELTGSEQFAQRDLLGQIRDQETRWGQRTAAAPLGSPQLLFVYRTDLFEQLGLAPPRTWAEYQTLVDSLRDSKQFTADSGIADSASWSPTVEPLAPSQAGALLLARAAAYATHRDQVAVLFNPDSMTPLIDQPPYLRALEELVAANREASQRSMASETVDQIAAGHAAMGIGFPASVVGAKNGESDNGASRLGFAPLPGSTEAFNFALGQWEAKGKDEDVRASLLGIPGRQAAVSSSASQNQAAISFLGWLASGEIAARVSPGSASTAPFRKSQLSETGRWLGLPPPAGASCAAAIEQSLSLKRGLLLPRIPGQDEYMAALYEAVQAAVGGEKSSQDALRDAALAWQAVTDRLGRDNQRLAYRRSLNVAEWP